MVAIPRVLRLALLLFALFGLVACSGDDEASGEQAITNSESGNARAVGSSDSPVADLDPTSPSPPKIVLRRGDTDLALLPFTYCWTAVDADVGICADGESPAKPDVLGGSGVIELYFPVDGFDFESRFWDGSYTTERPGPSLTKVADHWELDAPEELPAIIEIFGFDDNNDVIVAFRVDE